MTYIAGGKTLLTLKDKIIIIIIIIIIITTTTTTRLLTRATHESSQL